MLALRFSQFGDPDVLQVQDLAKPILQRGDVLVQVYAAAINPSDVKNVKGSMEQTTLPRTPGRDFAGIVAEGPQGLVGKQVWGTGGDIGFTRDGSHAQYLLLPQIAIYEKPANLSFTEAATVGVSYVTAWSALSEAAAITAEDVVAIVGANGSVGRAGIQITKWLGATVIGIVRHETQLQPVRQLGADYVINTSQTDMHAAIMDLTKGRGASLVFDTVGGAMFEPSLQLLAQCGRQIEITVGNQRRVSFDLRDFYHREARLFGVDSLRLTATAASALLAKLKPGFETGAFRPSPIAKTYPLAQGQQAYEHVLHGVEGKVVLMLR